ncbi:MAG: HAD family hydrolase [Anaerolineae bacterium]|nr:HAD family hydrolase [Anaerolineae bacterium]
MSLRDVRAISFDADGTLWDFERAMRHSLALALEEMRREVGSAAAGLDVEELIRIRDRVAASSKRLSLEEGRLEAFRETLRGIGHPDEALARRLCALYLHHRFRDIELYQDVLPALQRLRGRYRLGLLTNGNTNPERCGLAGVFDFVVMAQEQGFTKPDPRLFGLAMARAACQADEILHVGDSWDNDVIGALNAGLQAVWLNREGKPAPASMPGLREIRSLVELPGLLGVERGPSPPDSSPIS